MKINPFYQQAHLQSTSQTQSQQHDQQQQQQQTSQQQQILQQKNAITTIHSTNPEITALVTSFMNSESQFQQQAAGMYFAKLDNYFARY